MLDINNVATMAYGLAIVMAIIMMLSFTVKRMKWGKNIHSTRISMLGTMPIGHKEKVMLIKVEGQKILIGVTAHHIQTLALFNKSDKQPPGERLDFSQQLRSEIKQEAAS